MPAPRKYFDELRERSIRFACDLVEGPEKLSVNTACKRFGEQLGIQPDTLRNWVKQARVDVGAEPGVPKLLPTGEPLTCRHVDDIRPGRVARALRG